MKNFAEQKLKALTGNSAKGLGPTSAVVVTLGIYFGSQIIAVIALGAYAALQGFDGQVVGQMIEESVAGQFVYILLVEALTVYMLWLFLGRRKVSWQDIGLKKPKLSNFGYAIPVFGAYFLVAALTLALLNFLLPGFNVEQEQQIGFENATGFFQLFLVFASLVLMPAVVEEILVRGFLYGGLLRKFSKYISALLASAIFASAHLQFGSGEPLLWVAAIDTFILSLALIWLREKTGNIWSGVLVHMVKNGIAFVSIFIIGIA